MPPSDFRSTGSGGVEILASFLIVISGGVAEPDGAHPVAGASRMRMTPAPAVSSDQKGCCEAQDRPYSPVITGQGARTRRSVRGAESTMEVKE